MLQLKNARNFTFPYPRSLDITRPGIAFNRQLATYTSNDNNKIIIVIASNRKEGACIIVEIVVPADRMVEEQAEVERKISRIDERDWPNWGTRKVQVVPVVRATKESGKLIENVTSHATPLICKRRHC